MNSGAFNANTEDIFAGGGEMGALMRTIDWSKTSLGPVERWQQSLQTAVSISLFSRFPILIWWGKDYIKIYNDAYRPFLGTEKHPSAMGRAGQEVWAEIWDIIGPMLDSVYYERKSTWSDDQMLPMNRYGFIEETYFTFSYSPIFDETGGVGGIFTAVSETTASVLGERRLRLMHELSEKANKGKTGEEACHIAADVLANDPNDIPFAIIYLFDETHQYAHCVGACGVEIGTSICLPSIDIAGSSSLLWSFPQLLENGQSVRVENLASHFDSVPLGVWAEPPHTAVVLPIVSSGQTQVIGFFIAGVSPRLALDEKYQAFLELVAGHIASAIANARTYEEERRRTEALMELDRAKTEFFSNVSHEFRTPLTLMLNPLEDLLTETKDTISPKQREVLEIAHRNCLRLLKLVNTLLDFSRIHAHRVAASFEPTDFALMTADLASVFRSAIERAGMQFIVDCPPLSEPVYLDREMWEKIVSNLLSNAFKFTFEGEIVVSVREMSDHAALIVRDTGIGISDEDIPHIFERFQQVRGVRSRTFEGSGIGLALVHELVGFHGGRIEVSSQLEKGTVFTVFIPFGTAHLPAEQIGSPNPLSSTAISANAYLVEAMRWVSDEPKLLEMTTPTSEDVSPHPAPPVPDEARASILIVDDNADMRDYLQRSLESDYAVQLANNGQIALEMLRERRPDLVITDVMMPNLNGFELLDAIRGDHRLKTLPVIILSARAGEEALTEGLEAGADDYLVKPFSARELLARVEVHLRLAQMRQEINESNAVMQERHRIGRELHDSVNQTLFVVASLAESSVRVWERKPEQAIKLMQDVLTLSRGAIAEMRVLLLELRPEMILRTKFGELLKQLSHTVQSRKSIKTQFTVQEEGIELPDDVQVALYRIAQESVNNVIKHSEATQLMIELTQTNGVISLRIEDDGCGFDPNLVKAGLGQGTMRERAAAIQANLQLDTAQGKGTVITVTWNGQSTLNAGARF